MKKLFSIVVFSVLISCSEDKKDVLVTTSDSVQLVKDQTQGLNIIPSNVRLGDYSFIEIGVKNTLEASKRFYEILGFVEIPNQFEDENMMMMSDSNLILVLNKASVAPAMLIYLNNQIDVLAKDLKAEGVLVSEIKDGIELKSPDGIKVTVLNLSSEGLFRPTSKTMFQLMQTSEIADPKNLPNSKIGVFGELSHQSNDIVKALSYWAKLGIVGGGIMEFDYKYSIIMDKTAVIGIHEKQDKDWIGSAITYFATDQVARFMKLKDQLPASSFGDKSNIESGNIILKTPEGNLFFLFQL